MTPLFRKRTQADVLARRRERLRSHAALRPRLVEMLSGLGLSFEPFEHAFVMSFGPFETSVIVPFDSEGAVSGGVTIGDVTDRRGLRDLLGINFEHRVAYFVGGAEPNEIEVRFRVPADPFEPQAVIQALVSAAVLIEPLVDDDVSGLVGRLRSACEEQEPQPAREQAVLRLQRALGELELPARRHDDPDVWTIDTERGGIDAILGDSGRTWMLVHRLRWEEGEPDAPTLRWLLDASAPHCARLGLSEEPRGPGLHAVHVLPTPALQAPNLAFVLEHLLRLGNEVDRENGYG